MLALPLQVIDNFLIQYNVGQALLVVFVLATIGVLVQGSQKILGIHWITFGLVFLLTPSSMEPIQYKFLGLALLFLGPMLYVTARD